MMPELNKVEIYQLLFRLNRGFAFIVKHLMELEPMQMIAPKDMKLFQANAQELQAAINEGVLDTLHPAELEDMWQFEKVRIRREKELRDPDDVFLLAEERRKEIEKQKSKKKQKSKGKKR
jgi:hypothetical protein